MGWDEVDRKMEWKDVNIGMKLPAYSDRWRGLWEHFLNIIKGQPLCFSKSYRLSMKITAKAVEVYIDDVKLLANHQKSQGFDIDDEKSGG